VLWRILGRSGTLEVFIQSKKEKIVKTRIIITMLMLSFFVVMPVNAAEEVTTKANEPEVTARAVEKSGMFKTEMDKVSYIIGTQIGGNMKKAEVDINLELLMQGIKDTLEGKEPALDQAEMQKVYSAWQQEMREKQIAKQKKEAADNLAAGTAFLEANKAKEGVKVLPSGLQYKVITEGTGNIPTADDKVKTHYRGTLIDGTEFDSSYKRGTPAEFPVKGVIKGWVEALQLMKEGAKWELYIPANLAYGERGRPGIPANSTLIFEIELLEIVKPVVMPKAPKTPEKPEEVK
jgi:FKBP-type peptidyl-prolyl cis-trans isomerase